MNKIHEELVPPKGGLAIEVEQGQTIRLTDVEGRQVIDFVVFNLDDPREKFSASYSCGRWFLEPGKPYEPRTTIGEGDWLMSTTCRPLMTITKETMERKGVHDLHHRMCNRFFTNVYANQDLDGCHEIIANAVEPYGITYAEIPDPFNVFMNYPYVVEKGGFVIADPITKPGDYIEMRAEMDVLCAFANCPEDACTACNSGECTPVMATVFEDPSFEPFPVLGHYEWLMKEMKERGLR